MRLSEYSVSSNYQGLSKQPYKVILLELCVLLCHSLYLPGLVQTIQTIRVLFAAVTLQHRQEILGWWTVLFSQL